MTDPLTSQERAHLTAWWRRYDAATTTPDRDAIRSIIELYVMGATIRRLSSELDTFHKERQR